MGDNIRPLGRLLAVGAGLLLSVWRLLALLALVFVAVVATLVVMDGKSVGEALYLAAITFLTIGYGDVTPTTAVARIACVVLGFAGVLFMGIIVAASIKALERR